MNSGLENTLPGYLNSVSLSEVERREQTYNSIILDSFNAAKRPYKSMTGPIVTS